MKNKFEEHIKQSLENLEVEYNSTHWDDMQGRLEKVTLGKPSSIGKVVAIAASVLVASALVYYISSNKSPTQQVEEKVSAQRSVVAEKSTDINGREYTRNQNVSIQSKISEQKVVKQGTQHIDKKETQTVATSNRGNNETEQIISEVNKHNTSVVSDVQERKTSIQKSSVTTPSEDNEGLSIFHCDKNTACAGNSIQFTPDDPTIAGTYKWDFGDGKYSAEKSPVHSYKDAGIYSVKLQIIARDKKVIEKVMKNMITIHPVPSFDFDFSSSDESPTLNFTSNADGVSNLKWDFGDRQTSSERTVAHIYNHKGNYDVTLTGKNSYGCVATYSRSVNIDNDYNLLAPTAFSPNGDGLNDTWIPKALQAGDYVFTLTIFDNNGRVVYRTSDKNKPWDGANINAGDKFSWQASVKDKNGIETIYKGIIIIAE